MKKIKTINLKFTGLIIALICSNLLIAQPQGQHPEPPPIPNTEQIEKMVDELASELALTKEISEKIEILYKVHFKEIEAKLKTGRPAREEMETIKKEFEKQVLVLLTDEQRQKFIEFQKNKPPKH